MIERDYVQYALDNYRAPLFTMEEFTSDLKKVVSLKKLLRRYSNDGQLNERLVLNTITMIINQFGIVPTNDILFYKTEPEHHSILKTFLSWLNCYVDNELVDPLLEYDPVILDKLKDITCRSCLA